MSVRVIFVRRRAGVSAGAMAVVAIGLGVCCGNGAACAGPEPAAAAPGAARVSAPASAGETLARARVGTIAAVLGDRDAALIATGPSDSMGLPGTARLVLDGRGRSVLDSKGPIAYSEWCDGKEFVAIDLDGRPRRLVLGDRAESELAMGLLSGRLLDAEAGLRLTADPERSTEVLSAWTFTYDGGRARGRIAFSRETGALRSFALGGLADARQEWTLDGTASGPAGLRFPKTIRQSGREGDLLAFTVEKIEVVEAPQASLFRPGAVGLGASYDASVAPAIEVKRARTGHLLVKPMINGKDAGWFIFDTGAGMTVLSTPMLGKLGLESTGSVAAVGIGGAVESSFARADTLRLGPVTMEKPLMVVIDFTQIGALMGEEIGGVIGYDLINRCVTEIDMSAGAIALHDPSAYELPAGESWSDLLLYERHPCVKGTVEGHEGVFKLDTGAGKASVDMHAPAVRRWDMLKGRETKEAKFGGVGGFVNGRRGTVTSITFGGHTHENIEAGFALEAKGAYADEYTAGNIGGKLMAPYRMVFDYRNERVAFVKKP